MQTFSSFIFSEGMHLSYKDLGQIRGSLAKKTFRKSGKVEAAGGVPV